MTNSTKTTKISSIFLAAILVAGTITAVYPSFVIGAQAQSEIHYGKDNYKPKDSTALLKKIKCNNIDVNANGIEITALPPSLSGLLASEAEVADEGQYGASSYGSGEGSYGSGGQSSSDKDFKFVCINNNNNTVIGGGGEEPIPEPDLSCEECFSANSTLQRIIIDFLSRGDIALTISSFTRDDTGQLIVDVVAAGGQINTIEKLCNEIEKSVEFLGVKITDETMRNLLVNIIINEIESPEVSESSVEELINCLLEKGLIEDRDFGPDSLSGNGLSSPNVQVAHFGLN